MAALDIRPHSHRLSVLAVGGVAVLSAGAFAAGLERGLQPPGPAPFPPPQARSAVDPPGPKAPLELVERPRLRYATPDLTDSLPTAPAPATEGPAAGAADAVTDTAASIPAPTPAPPQDPTPADEPPHA